MTQLTPRIVFASFPVWRRCTSFLLAAVELPAPQNDTECRQADKCDSGWRNGGQAADLLMYVHFLSTPVSNSGSSDGSCYLAILHVA